MAVEAGEPIGPPVGVDGRRQERWGVRGSRQRGKSGVGWTVAYYFLLVAGAVGFWKALWVLTESEGRLVDF